MPQPFFKTYRLRFGNVLEMGLHRFPQKCVSDQREEMHFCRPNFLRRQKLPNFYRLGMKIFQIQEKSPVFG